MPIINIAPKGSLHIGRLGVGREASLPYVPSDTLFAAIVATLAQTKEGVGSLDLAHPPFMLTSAFPRIGEARLYPRPLLPVECDAEKRESLGKTLTRFAWCSPRIFDALRRGHDVTAWADEKYFVQGGEVWLHPEDVPKGFQKLSKFWATDPPVARVALHRVSNAANLFHSGRVQFAPGCGLWFALTPCAPEDEARLKRALTRLADGGLGGLRSVGMGGFDYTWQTDSLQQPPGELGVTLSRYLPEDAVEIGKTLKAARAAYQLVVVGGWCKDDDGHPWRRKRVRFVREGSLLGWGGGSLGRVADVTPDDAGRFANGHRVLRYGMAFMLPAGSEVST